jgi:hypothetical protein
MSVKRLLLLVLCAALSIGAPLSFGSTAKTPCEASMGDAGDAPAPDCGCGAPDKAACAAHCNAMSSAQILVPLSSSRLEVARVAPIAACPEAFWSIAGPPGRQPPK